MRKKVLSIFLALVMVLCLVPVTALATDTWTEVSTEEALLSALENGGNIRLKNDISILDCTLDQTTISNAVNLDLNGKEMDYNSMRIGLYIANGGVLTVSDSNDNGSGSLLLTNMKIQTGGSLTLNSGNVVCVSQIINTGTVTMNGGLLKGGFQNVASSLFYMNGGEIKCGSYRAIDNKGGTIYAGGGTVSSTAEDGVACQFGKIISGVGTEKTAFNCKVQISSGGTVADGIYNQKVTVYADIGKGAAQITGGTYNDEVDNRGIITGGTFNGPVINASSYVDGYGKTVECQSIISGGTFKESVTNNGTITGGTYYGGILGTGTIDGLTVTYKNGNEDYAVQVVQNGDNASEPISPKQVGYIFGGWYTDPECTTAFDFENTPVTTAITLYGKMIECDHTGNTNALSCTEDTICSVCSGTIKAAHILCWKADATHYWQECYRSGCDYTTVNNKKEIPTIEIKGKDNVHTDQDYSFSFTLSDGLTFLEAGYEFTGKGGQLTDIGTSSPYTVTLEADWYDLNDTQFKINVYATTTDGYTVTATKTVDLLVEHELTHTPAKAATTTEAGNKEYWYCDVCEKYFSDADAANVITDGKNGVVIPKLPVSAKSADTTGKTNAPKTGDNSNLILWLALLLVSGGTVTAATITSKKRKYNR